MRKAADFRWRVCRFRFRALDELRFPAHSGNMLRGTLGYLLEPGVFRPPARAGLPSGLSTPPPPFVVRSAHLNNTVIEEGGEWAFGLNVFDPALAIEPAWATIGGARVQVLGVETEQAGVDLMEAPLATPRLRVDFETPTDLKGHEDPAVPPPFDVLLKRVRDRVSTLRQLYGEGPPAIDFRGMGERSQAVVLESGSVTPVALKRRSRRTGEIHDVGGFVGSATYSGSTAEFVPWLKAAEATGVGRHTVWGNGALRVTVL